MSYISVLLKLHDISLQHNSIGIWLWRINSIDGYLVRGVYVYQPEAYDL